MDPVAALSLVRDHNADLNDRMEAALALSRWHFNGGFLPEDMTEAQRAALRTFHVDARALLAAL